MAEWFHHRHVVHVARSSIQLEMEDNRKLLAADLASLQQDQTRIASNVKQLVALRAGAKLERASLQYYLDWSTFSDSAWRTAQSTEALTFMDYKIAEGLTGVYLQQRIVSDRGLTIFDDQSRAISPIFFTGDPNQMSKEEIQIVLLRTADVLLELKALEQLLKQLDEQFAAELQSDATGH
jgi:hypothetical protein